MRRRRLVVRGDDGAPTLSPPSAHTDRQLTGRERLHNHQSECNFVPGNSCLATSALLATSQHRHSRIRQVQAVPKDKCVCCAAPHRSGIPLQVRMPVALLLGGSLHQAGRGLHVTEDGTTTSAQSSADAAPSVDSTAGDRNDSSHEELCLDGRFGQWRCARCC